MASPPLWTDSHCHLQEPLGSAQELEPLLARAVGAGVERLVCIGTDAETSAAAVELAGRVTAANSGAAVAPFPAAWATVGLHPHDASDGLGPLLALLGRLLPGRAEAPRPPGSVVAIGECGLDYHYDHSPRPLQREAFAEQVGIAAERGLALVVHTREAWDDTVSILAEAGTPAATVIHCFTGGPDEAWRLLELGAHLSFSGIVTFPNAAEVREAARLCPEERLLVETDSPFLAPVPHRGRPNEPALVPVVGAALAALRGVEPSHIAGLTSANASRLYGLPVA